MALRTIVQDGDPILKKVCRPVTKFEDRRGTLQLGHFSTWPQSVHMPMVR